MILRRGLGTLSPAFFNAAAYLAANPDVAADPYYGAHPYEHYVQHGAAEIAAGQRSLGWAQDTWDINPRTGIPYRALRPYRQPIIGYNNNAWHSPIYGQDPTWNTATEHIETDPDGNQWLVAGAHYVTDGGDFFSVDNALEALDEMKGGLIVGVGAPFAANVLVASSLLAAPDAIAASSVASSAAPAASAWEAELAAGWEGAAATSAVQNVAIAEVTGQVAAGTLAQSIGAEAAAAALADAAGVVGAGATAASASTPIEELPPEVKEPPEIRNPSKSLIEEYGPKVFKAGQALYQYVVKRNAAGKAQSLVPRRVGTMSLNGEPVYFGNAGASVSGWQIGAGILGLLALSGLWR